jgi:hypothetical protein
VGLQARTKIAADLDYVPMPDAVVSLIEKIWKEIKGPDGKPCSDGRQFSARPYGEPFPDIGNKLAIVSFNSNADVNSGRADDLRIYL